MTARLQLMFAGEKTAAALLDMKPTEFRQYVEQGILPPPTKLGRWDVEQLRVLRKSGVPTLGGRWRPTQAGQTSPGSGSPRTIPHRLACLAPPC